MAFDDLPDTFPTGNNIPAGSDQPFLTGDPARDGVQGDVHWKLQSVEPPGLKFQNFTISGQLPVTEEGITWRRNQVIAEASTYSQQNPFVQWIRGELQVISFDVVLFSRDKDEDIKAIYNGMLAAQTYVPELNRIPICRFTYGNFDSVKCQCAGFGDVKIFRLKPDGKARRIEFQMTLKKYIPYKIKEIDRNKKPKFSRAQMVSGDERMYEILARREYGIDASIYGVNLRRLNRADSFAASDGGIVKVPRGDKIAVGRLRPEQHALQTEREETAAVFLSRASARRDKFLIV
jgi:hypothetical protein